MKNYKFLVPIVLIVAFVASIFSLMNQKTEVNDEYDKAIKKARALRADGIYVDADEYYQQALEVKNTKELNYEIGKMYLDQGELRKAEDWGETFKGAYPNDPEPYEFMIDVLSQNYDYTTLWQTYKEMEKRRISSKKADEVIAKIEYEYYLSDSYENVGVFSSGLCPVLLKGKWGFVNSKGSKAVPIKFNKVGAFSSSEMAPVTDENNGVYFIDTEGNKKRLVKGVDGLTELGYISNEIFPLKSKDVWSYYNLDGKKLFGDFSNASAMANGMAAVEKNDRWTVIDSKGKSVSDKTFDDVIQDEKTAVVRNNRLFVQKDGYYYMVDENLKEVSDQKFTNARLFNDKTYAAVAVDDKWGFIDSKGKLVIEPQYEEARSFSNGLAAVKENGKWGYIDKSGKMVITPEFYGAMDFSEKGTTFVNDGDEWELLTLYKFI